MITYVNNTNASKYAVLFEKATQALIEAEIEATKEDPSKRTLVQVDKNGEPQKDESNKYVAMDPIDSIEKYFYYLPQLLVLGDSESTEVYKVLHSEGRRYTMLPIPASANVDSSMVSEGVFEVDADARKINIPSTFNSNGVAVQGDELAEVLYFRIDRYFDAMDLDTADIFIQWTNANGESGVSMPWVVDIEREPNKIYIGWALSSAITAKSGNVKFALRFYKFADAGKTKLSYSWATQEAQISVKSTLDFKLTDKSLYDSLTSAMVDAEKNMISRIKDSKTKLTHKDTVETPVYVLNLDAAADGKFVVFDAENKILYADLSRDEVEGKDLYTLKVEARSTDGGTISYKWQFINDQGQVSDLGSEEDMENGTHSKVSIQFVETEDTEVKNKLYYEKDGDVYRTFDTTSLGTNTQGEKESPKDRQLYEKIACCSVFQVGKFRAVSSNSKVNINSKDLASFTCIIPMPIAPQIKDGENLPERAILTEEKPVQLAVGVDNEEIENHTRPGVLSYQWFKQDTENEKVWNPIDEEPIADKKELKLVFDESKIEGDAAKEIEGNYKVIITNAKNGEEKTTESAICRVSHMVTKPVISFPTKADSDTKVSFNNGKAVKDLEIKLDPTWSKKWNISDKLEYRWYFSADQTADPTMDSDGDGDYDDRLLTEEGQESVEGANKYMPTAAGKYYCVVTNVKNGEEASALSEMFYVV